MLTSSMGSPGGFAGVDGPAASALPVDGDGECRIHLRAHLIGHVGSDGGVRDRCGSRVLETALMLHLLRVEGLFPGAQRSLAGFLASRARCAAGQGARSPEVAAFEDALADRMLGGHAHASSSALEVLADFAHFTSERKQFMFHTLLTELGVLAADDRFDPAKVGYAAYATWVNLEMCALKILRAHQCGRKELVEVADRDFLLGQLSGGSLREVFEADVLAHLVALLAVRRVAPGHRLLGAGAEVLLRCQNPDGGLPFIAGWEPFATAVTGLALAEVGARQPLLEHMGRYVAGHQGSDGGWPFAPGVTQSDADCSPYCLEFLRAAGTDIFGDRIIRAEDYLLGLVNADGGFGTYRRGDDSEVGVTGSAVSALAPARDRCADRLDAAVMFLLGRLRPDGTFERGWSLSDANATFRAVFALRHHPSAPSARIAAAIESAVGGCVGHLVSVQNGDGGWGQRPGRESDVLSTAYSLLALSAAATAERGSRLAGLEYLVRQQQADGGFSSIPDSAGPRPVPHDLPVLADAFAALALGRLLGPPPEDA